jgi:hypothetical protein
MEKSIEDYIEDNLMETDLIEAEANSMMVVSATQTKRSAKDLAGTVWKFMSEGGKNDEVVSIIISVIAEMVETKKEALVVLYSLIEEMAVYDKTGDLCASILEANLLKEIYKTFGASVEDGYVGVMRSSLKNTKAYLVDAFVFEYYPLYSNGAFGPQVSVAREMIYPERFLNILFRAIKRCHENDLKVLENIANYQMQGLSANEEKKLETLAQNISVLEAKFAEETALILDLFSKSDKERMYSLFLERLDCMLGGEESRPNASVNENALLSTILGKLSALPEAITKEVITTLSTMRGTIIEEITGSILATPPPALEDKSYSNQNNEEIELSISEANKGIRTLLDRMTSIEEAVLSIGHTTPILDAFGDNYGDEEETAPKADSEEIVAAIEASKEEILRGLGNGERQLLSINEKLDSFQNAIAEFSANGGKENKSDDDLDEDVMSMYSKGHDDDEMTSKKSDKSNQNDEMKKMFQAIVDEAVSSLADRIIQVSEAVSVVSENVKKIQSSLDAEIKKTEDYLAEIKQ